MVIREERQRQEAGGKNEPLLNYAIAGIGRGARLSN